MTALWLPLTHVACVPGIAARPFAIRGATRLSHADFVRRAQDWCRDLSRRAGTRWALHTDDAAEFACLLAGAWLAGKCVYVPGDALPATLRALQTQVDGVLGTLPGAPADPVADAADVAGAAPAALDPQRTELVLFTSGSSGNPVAIPKQLRQLDAEIQALEAAFGAALTARTATTVIATVSHQHIYGLLFQVLWSLAAGRAIHARRLEHLESLPRELAQESGILITSPAVLSRLPQSLAPETSTTLVAVFSSGGPLSATAAADTQARLGQLPFEVFGSTETGGIAWRQQEKSVEAWRALPGVDWRIDDKQLSVRSAHLPDDDWQTTADRIEAVAGGGFRPLGRIDRITKVGEKRVSLTAIENLLADGTDLQAVRVFLRSSTEPADGASARVAAIAVPTPAGWIQLQAKGRRAFIKGLRARLDGAVERVALPRWWRFVEALPLNSQGKCTEPLLAALFDLLPASRPAPHSVTRDGNRCVIALVPSAGLPVFDGHFPQTPVLPGVVQIDWAIEYGRQVFGIDAAFSHIESLKFRRVIAPGTELALEIEWTPSRRVLAMSWQSGQGEHTSGRILFRE